MQRLAMLADPFCTAHSPEASLSLAMVWPHEVVEAMQALQCDTMHPGALALRDALLRRLPAPGPRQHEAHAALAAWDGS